MNVSICEAIAERRLIRFSYNGGSRLVEPYTYGLTRAGHEVLRGYQVGGQSDSGQPAGWKLFTVSGIEDLVVTRDCFDRDQPGYKSDDPAIVDYFARIEEATERRSHGA